MDLQQQYENFRPTTIGELWSRQKTIEEILNWIESETDISGKTKYFPSCEMIVQHLKKM